MQNEDAARKRSVAFLIDFENILRSLQYNFANPPSDTVLASVLREMACEHGNVLISHAYGDWTELAGAARAFQREGIDPRMVLRKESGGDRSDMVTALDIQTLLFERTDIDTYVLATGDTDFREIVRRLKSKGKRAIVCGIAKTTGRELIVEADSFVPLEGRIENLAPIGRAPPERPHVDADYDWGPFVRALDEAERQLPFVGLKHFRDKWIGPDMVAEDTARDRHRLLRGAEELGIVESYKQPNPRNPRFPTAAVRLVRTHPIVQACLGTAGATGAQGQNVG